MGGCACEYLGYSSLGLDTALQLSSNASTPCSCHVFAPTHQATQPVQGTSMATPVVAGSAALLRQYFTDGFWPSGAANPADAFVPSAALLRAVLIGGAVAIDGVEANANGLPVDPPPSSRQGFGRIHLGAREGLRRLGRWEGAGWVKRSASQQGACNLGHMLPAQLPPKLAGNSVHLAGSPDTTNLALLDRVRITQGGEAP